MNSILLFSIALILEGGSWYALLTPLEPLFQVLLFISLHAAASLVLALALWKKLPRKYRLPFRHSILMLAGLSFFIPFIGPAGLILSVCPALFLPKNRDSVSWTFIGLPDLPKNRQVQGKSPLFRDGNLKDVLIYAQDAEQRLNALLATRHMDRKDVIPMLKLALADPADDVRLLAYSMLDQQESTINKKIENALALLPRAKNIEQQNLHGQLAFLYWELAYLGLAQGSVFEHVLQQANRHISLAGDQQTGTPKESMVLLAARIAIAQNRTEDAKSLLHKAEKMGINHSHTLPLLAEAAFLSQQYEEMKEYLARMPADVAGRPPFKALTTYWLS